MKIIQVLNAIITNSHKISNVIKRQHEYYFLYDKKFKWSISKRQESEDYYVHFYPSPMSIEELSNFESWADFDEIVTYSTKDLKTQEAYETFTELYQVIGNKLYNIDDIFDEILNA